MRWSPPLIRWRTSTTAMRTCWTARTSAASSSSLNLIGEPRQHRLDRRTERPQLRGAQPVEYERAHEFDVSRRGGVQRGAPGVGELDGCTAAVVTAAVAFHQTAAAHPSQLM